MTEQHCPTKIITDIPAENDFFGGHKKVAKSIVETILTEKGGQTIGLEGGWGSGKSTIVKLATKILRETNQNESITFYVFDAWAHQGDPLRRTFLEQLISHLQSIDWIDTENWDQKKAELAKRTRREKQYIMPRFTGFGVIFTLSLFAIPVGASLISTGFIILGAVISTLPFLIFLIGYLWGVCKRVLGETQANNKIISELPAIVTGQTKTEINTTVTQTPDPTSVEFEYEFRNLLDEALKQDNKKIVLVVDNLDRIDPSDALSIWSTLQTFLGHSDHEKYAWRERLWVLIPFDKDSILRLWGNQFPSCNNNQYSATDKGKNDVHFPLACSFLDKTFQIRFRVPPLLLSNWRRFLEGTLHQAFPDHQESDFHDVYRAYASNKGIFEQTAPTPRELKLFVNQIGALHREWQDDFLLSYFACYVLLQNAEQKMLDIFLSGEKVPEYPAQIIGENWREVLAALHFGLPVQEARQLLLRDPIQNALVNGDGETLFELESSHSEGFWTVLEDVVPAGQANWTDLSPLELANAAKALVSSGLIIDRVYDSRPEVLTLQFQLREAVKSIDVWDPLNSTVAQGMVAACQLLDGTEEIVNTLLEGASKTTIRDSKEDKETQISAGEWLASIVILTRGIYELGLSEYLEKGIGVSLNLDQWIEASNFLSEEDLKFLIYLKLEAITEIDNVLAQRIAPDELNEEVMIAVQAALTTQSKSAMKNTAKGVLSQLQTTNTIPGDKLAYLLNLLRWCRATGAVDDNKYKEFSDSGYFLHHLNQAYSEKHAGAAAMCIYGFLEIFPEQNKPEKPTGNSEAGYEKLIELLKNPDKIENLSDNFTMFVDKEQNLPLVISMANAKKPVPALINRSLIKLLNNSDIPKRAKLVRDNWLLIRNALDEDVETSQSFTAFLKYLPESHELVELVLNEEFDSYDSGLYFSILESDADSKLIDWCAKGLSDLSQNIWLEAIETQNDLLKLLLKAKRRAGNIKLGVSYRDALTEYASKIARRQVEALPHETWKEIFELLAPQYQELFSRQAYELLEKVGGKISEEFFNLFANSLPSSQELANQQQFAYKVCRPILEAGNVKGLEWLADVFEAYPGLLEEHKHKDSVAVDDFKERLQQTLRETDNNIPIFRELLRTAQVLNIKWEDESNEIEGEDDNEEPE